MEDKRISRRDFFKSAGAAGIAAAGLAACGGNGRGTPSQEPSGGMTYRTLTGDRVSLLGYGCMRWPMKSAPDGSGQIVDQEQVNRLVDYALEHGVNYFDTAPPYCQGMSEEATGIALSRHPRDSYYIATKMSNHRLYGAGLRGRELYDASVEMYRNSFKSLRTDYFDYYLFHILGSGAGMEEMRGRTSSSRKRRPGASASSVSRSTAMCVCSTICCRSQASRGISCRYSSTTWTGSTPPDGM